MLYFCRRRIRRLFWLEKNQLQDDEFNDDVFADYVPNPCRIWAGIIQSSLSDRNVTRNECFIKDRSTLRVTYGVPFLIKHTHHLVATFWSVTMLIHWCGIIRMCLTQKHTCTLVQDFWFNPPGCIVLWSSARARSDLGENLSLEMRYERWEVWTCQETLGFINQFLILKKEKKNQKSTLQIAKTSCWLIWLD